MFKVIKFNRLLNYADGLDFQNKAFESVKNEEYDGMLLILEHTPVFTFGTGGGFDNFLMPKKKLSDLGIDLVKTKRGGNVTFHGPGQIVAYPIFNLAKLQKDSHWYMHCVEEVVIKTLEEFGIKGSRKPKYRGVWVEDRKISAVGIRISKWITMHGLGFNINVDKKYFDMINPCGITEFGVASLEDFGIDMEIEDIKDVLISNFEKVFEIELIEDDEKILGGRMK